MLFRLLSIAALAIGLVVGLPLPNARAQAQSASLDASLAELRSQIRAAEEESAHFESGLILNQILLRLSVLRSAQAMLEQKRLALLHGIPVVWHDDVPARTLLPEDRERIAREADAARAEVAAAEREAALYSGGLIQAMALVRAATAKVKLAVLDEQRVLAEAGMPLRLLPSQDAAAGTPASPGKAVSDRDALR